jgi:E3 SUMO-protein ligase PIAS1
VKGTIPLSSTHIQRLRDTGSKTARVLVYCGESGSQSNNAIDITFPQNIELRVNGEDVKANTKGVKKKPGSTKPADITALLKKQPGSSNVLEIVYALTDKTYSIMVMLVTKKSVDQLRSVVENRRFISIERVLTESKFAFRLPDVHCHLTK